MTKKHLKNPLKDLNLAIKRGSKKNFLVVYFKHHFHAAFLSFDRLLCAPVSSLLTITVIAIALSLPVGLEVLWQNAKNLSPNLDRGTQISLYLKKPITQYETSTLSHRLMANPNVAKVRYISAEEGLNTLQESLGVKDILQQLKDNPLPEVIIVTPKETLISPTAITDLLNELRKLPAIASAQLDKIWIERLYYIMDLVRHIVLALLILFSSGVILIVGNTIRLAMQSAHKEITVLKLVGATDAFVRRPFLYTGFYYGLFGSLLAWLIVTITLTWLQNPIKQLALSYGSDFILRGLNQDAVFDLLLIGVLLGLSGARLALAKHLKKN